MDCDYFKSGDGQTYMVGVQLLAQLRTQGSVNLIKDGTLVYDPDSMNTTLQELKKLAGHDAGLGDPGPDVDVLIQANDQAKAILAIDGDVPESMFADLTAIEGDTGAFIMRMGSINAALSDVCG